MTAREPAFCAVLSDVEQKLLGMPSTSPKPGDYFPCSTINCLYLNNLVCSLMYIALIDTQSVNPNVYLLMGDLEMLQGIV